MIDQIRAVRAGDVFAGFRIEKRLGVGGTGEVYLARDRDLPRLVALKLLTRTAGDCPDIRKRFLREANTVAQLSHPNIVTIYARGEEQGQLWISMAHVPGADLATALRHGPMDPTRTVRILSETADAIDHVHDSGILHRDVKPANILLTNNPRERALLTDFGIATALHEPTDIHQLLATFQYAAPEQFLSPTTVDHRADIYALGCTFYYMLTGEPPFPPSGLRQLMHKHINQPPPAPSTRNPHIPTTFDPIVLRALAKNPADRFNTCAALATAATHALTGIRPAKHEIRTGRAVTRVRPM